MTIDSFGTVTALEFRAKPDVDFPDFVEEMDLALQLVDAPRRSVSWQGDKIAMIDRDYLRIALGLLEGRERGDKWYLILSVGNPPTTQGRSGGGIDPTSLRFLTDRIIERSEQALMPTAVLRGEAFQPVDAGLIENVVKLLQLNTPDRTGMDQGEPAPSPEDPKVEQGAAPLALPEPSDPMRLTIHTLALSMCIYAPPVGAAMFAYTMLRDVFPVAVHAV